MTPIQRGSAIAAALVLSACGGGGGSSAPLAHVSSGGHGRAVATVAQPPAYVSAVLADSPVVYYRMNDVGGTTAVDSSGNGYDGTYGSSVVLGNSAVVNADAAPTFPGGTGSTATVLRSSTNAALALGSSGAMSAELWVSVPASLTGQQIIWSQPFQSGAGNLPAYIALSGGSAPFFTVQVATPGGAVAAYPAAVTNAKNHVVLTWNGTTLTGYVDGVAGDSATGSGSLTNFKSPYTGFTAGGPTDAHTGYAGAVGEVALYGTALSATRVAAHYAAGSATRSSVWSIGSQFHEPGSSDAQGPDEPVFATTAATCTSNNDPASGPSYECTGGAGAVSFQVNRPNTTTVPAAEYRNMIVPEGTDGLNLQLAPGGMYDFVWSQVNNLAQDAANVQMLFWQDHPGSGTVETALGLINRSGTGFEVYLNAGGSAVWHGSYTQGTTDKWEIQLKNSADSNGWLDLYRNNVLQYSYNGPIVPTTTYDLNSFGIYYYNWNISRSTLLQQNLKLNSYTIYTIPGRVAPVQQ